MESHDAANVLFALSYSSSVEWAYAAVKGFYNSIYILVFCMQFLCIRLRFFEKILYIILNKPIRLYEESKKIPISDSGLVLIHKRLLRFAFSHRP